MINLLILTVKSNMKGCYYNNKIANCEWGLTARRSTSPGRCCHHHLMITTVSSNIPPRTDILALLKQPFLLYSTYHQYQKNTSWELCQTPFQKKKIFYDLWNCRLTQVFVIPLYSLKGRWIFIHADMYWLEKILAFYRKEAVNWRLGRHFHTLTSLEAPDSFLTNYSSLKMLALPLLQKKNTHCVLMSH